MKTIIHVNQHIVKRNKKQNTKEAVITTKTYKTTKYGHSISILGASKVVYSPDKLLSCGAAVWIETTAPVVVYNYQGDVVE